jgi:UDP-2,3-diacylglucosamine pyrophosphatase LpxH
MIRAIIISSVSLFIGETLLIIISDLHLVDGTSETPSNLNAFIYFASRVNEMATNASFRSDQTYRPLERIDIILLGDILDPLHSIHWFDDLPGQPGFTRPWMDTGTSSFSTRLRDITHAILQHNAGSTRILRDLASGRIIHLLPADRNGQVARDTKERVPVQVRLHYMVGNHDWYYHLPGTQFDGIREEIINNLGLSNPNNPAIPFPHQAWESDTIQSLFGSYHVHARHGDMYDPFNFDTDLGRNASSLGDAFTIEMVNRFPLEVERQLGKDLSPELLDSLHELVNVRPLLVTPLWISGQLLQKNVPMKEQMKIKEIWDGLGREFLNLEFIREIDHRLKFDVVDAMQVLLQFTRRTSFKTLETVVSWIRDRIWSGELNFSQNALKEPAFIDRTAQFIVYGHTHFHEIVPLDSYPVFGKKPINQIYFNTGTWHNYYDLAAARSPEQKFIPYRVQSYLAFYRDGQRGGRHFETWHGTFSE